MLDEDFNDYNHYDDDTIITITEKFVCTLYDPKFYKQLLLLLLVSGQFGKF